MKNTNCQVPAREVYLINAQFKPRLLGSKLGA